MLLYVNTYSNSVIESSLASVKFMQVIMNVNLPYRFNCWCKWMYILRKWTAKGVKDNFCIYLHCTLIVAVFVELPHSLLASHLYSPSWLLLICVTSNMCPLWRWPPGLIQDTVGKRTPDTWHDRVTLWPSVIFWSCVIWVIEEGTVKEKWECGRILKVASEQLVHFNTCIISFPTTARSSLRPNCHQQTSR